VLVYSYRILSMWTLETVTVMISFAVSPCEVMRFCSESVTSVLSWTKFKVFFAFIHCESRRKRGEVFLKIKKAANKITERMRLKYW